MPEIEKKSAASDAGKPGPKLVTATVAPGRTVLHTPHFATGEVAEPEREYRPGEQLEMPAAEVRRLRELGFLIDPSGGQIVALGGPALRNDI